MPAHSRVFAGAHALIIDNSAASRHSMQLALSHLGVESVSQAARATDARRFLSQRTFGIILCEYRFDQGMTGRELFLQMRQTRALPLSTIFFMVTSEATLSKVADIAEFAPDDYLLKPITPALLEERLMLAKEKKEALAELYDAFEKEDYQSIIDVGTGLLALQGFEYRLDVSRILAQAHLALDQADAAVRLYDSVLAQKAVPWARVGVNHAGAAAQTAASDSALRNLVSESASYLDAYDKLARMRAREGRFSEALEIYQRALQLTPNHVNRLQAAGQLSFFLGDAAQGAALLDRAMKRATRTSVLDLRSMLHLALMHLDNADQEGVEHLASGLLEARDKSPTDFRAAVLSRLGGVCAQLGSRQLSKALQEIRQVALLIPDARMSFELACDLLAVLVRLYTRDVQTDLDVWTARVARRFSVSNQSAALMTDIVRQSPALAGVIREHSASIQKLANEGMQRLVAGDPREAARTLLASGEETLNARLLAIACNAAARHSAQDADPETRHIARQSFDLIQRVGEGGLHLPQELADRVRQFGATLQEEPATPATDSARE